MRLFVYQNPPLAAVHTSCKRKQGYACACQNYQEKLSMHTAQGLLFMRLAISAAIGVTLTGCSGRLGQDKMLTATTACHVKGLEREARCGTLAVPEDPAKPQGKTIEIAYVVVPARARYKEPDAVFALAGGPGQSARSIAGSLTKVFVQTNARRDLVFVDQRGTGNSNGFACTDLSKGLSIAQQLDMQAMIARTNACKNNLPGDARHYITSTAVKDYDAVRAYLGYPQINVWGGSYGTRAALEYTRQFPAAVRTLMLDSVAPADMRLPVAIALDAQRTLLELTTACEKDAQCSAQYPALRSRIERMFSGNSTPLAITDPYTQQQHTYPVDSMWIAQALRAPLYAPQLASVLPHAVLRATQGDGDPLVALAASLGGSDEGLSIAMHLSVVCAEDVDRIDEAALESLKSTLFNTKYVEQYRAMCAGWPRGAVPAAFYEPVKGDMPVLILSGALDPVTPPRHGDQVAKWFSRAQHLIAPNQGHIVSGFPCAPELLHKFVKSAGQEKLDGACLAKPPRPTFYQHVQQPVVQSLVPTTGGQTP
jgi:pimeloyl-ACP methyl ester carboxylesterase